VSGDRVCSAFHAENATSIRCLLVTPNLRRSSLRADARGNGIVFYGVRSRVYRAPAVDCFDVRHGVSWSRGDSRADRVFCRRVLSRWLERGTADLARTSGRESGEVNGERIGPPADNVYAFEPVGVAAIGFVSSTLERALQSRTCVRRQVSQRAEGQGGPIRLTASTSY
jgi:hypothetical protein